MSVSVGWHIRSLSQRSVGDRVLPRMSDQVQDHVVLRLVVRPIRLARAGTFDQLRDRLRREAELQWARVGLELKGK
jgi:hypothetical protein